MMECSTVIAPDGKNINKEMIEKAHVHGIIFNVFYSDTVEFAKELLTMGQILFSLMNTSPFQAHSE